MKYMTMFLLLAKLVVMQCNVGPGLDDFGRRLSWANYLVLCPGVHGEYIYYANQEFLFSTKMTI